MRVRRREQHLMVERERETGEKRGLAVEREMSRTLSIVRAPSALLASDRSVRSDALCS